MRRTSNDTTGFGISIRIKEGIGIIQKMKKATGRLENYFF